MTHDHEYRGAIDSAHRKLTASRALCRHLDRTGAVNVAPILKMSAASPTPDAVSEPEVLHYVTFSTGETQGGARLMAEYRGTKVFLT